MDPNLPAFSTEVRFYSKLGIGYRFGSRLLRLEVLKPDADLDGRPIFLNDIQSLERHRAEIRSYRSRIRHIQHNALAHA
jgi:hypothetical protein